jgi:hypothetical protein
LKTVSIELHRTVYAKASTLTWETLR